MTNGTFWTNIETVEPFNSYFLSSLSSFFPFSLRSLRWSWIQVHPLWGNQVPWLAGGFLIGDEVHIEFDFVEWAKLYYVPRRILNSDWLQICQLSKNLSCVSHNDKLSTFKFRNLKSAKEEWSADGRCEGKRWVLVALAAIWVGSIMRSIPTDQAAMP